MSAFSRKYGVATTINFPLVKRAAVDFATSSDYTFASGDAKIKKDEGASANTTNSLAHEGEGIWSLALSSTEMEAARIVITVVDSATKAVEDQCVIIETYGHASAQHEVFPANVTQLSGDAQSLADLKDFADAGYDPATNKVEGVKLADTLTTYTGNTPQTGDSYAIVNHGTNGNAAIKTQVAAIETDTQDIQGRLPAALTGDGNMKADALRISGDATAADNAELFFDGTGYNASNSTVGTATTVTNGVTVSTNNDKTGYSLSSAAIQAIWDALTSALTTVGSIGKLLVDNINATIGSRLASSSYTTPPDATAIQTAAAAALTAYDPPTRAEATSDKDAVIAAIPAAVAVADAVLDEAMSGHTTAGTLGKAVADILVDTDTTLPGLIEAIEGGGGGGGGSITVVAQDREVYGEYIEASQAIDRNFTLSKLDTDTGEEIALPEAAIENAVVTLRKNNTPIGTSVTFTMPEDGEGRIQFTVPADAVASDKYEAWLDADYVSGSGTIHARVWTGVVPAESGEGEFSGETTSFAEAALQQLANNGIHYRQPLGQGNAVSIVRGMDYDHDDDRALNWTDAHSAWPVLTGATITVEVKRGVGNISRTYTGSVVTATGDTKQVRLQLTAAQTSDLELGEYTYGVKATLSSGNVVDLVGPKKRWEVVALS